jgi:hypothetical protein
MEGEVVADRFELADVVYVKENFFSLEDLCVNRDESPADVLALIETEQLPRPAYTLDDGSEWFPAGYFDLLERSGGVEQLRAEFRKRILAAGGSSEDDESAWPSYLAGEFFWCLLDASPENMMLKERCCTAIEALLEDPQPQEASWQAQLRREVWILDSIERRFAPHYDRSGRLGAAPSRDRLIEEPRRTYHEVFEAPTRSRYVASA